MVASAPVVPVSMPVSVSSGCGGMGCGGNGAAGFSMGGGAMGMGMGGGAMGMGMGGGMNAYQMEMAKEMMEHHQEMHENMYGEMGEFNNEFEEPEMMEFDGEDMMGMHGGYMNGGAMMGMNGGAMMGMNGGMNVAQTVIPVTGVRYKLKPYTYKYEYPVWKPDTHMAFQQTTYNNPCANGCNSANPHCCHKEVTYVPKTVPKVVEETVSVPVEVDVPNVSCGCHASRPHCCGKRRPVSSRSSGCSCHASAPHCCHLSSPKWAYERQSRNQHYGAVGYPFQY